MPAGDNQPIDGIRIAFFEDWMAPQVIEMTALNYNRDVSRVTEFFQSFYEHPFQRDRGIRLVALDGDKVCGFQSYFYWPYFSDGKAVRSFQSGQSLVAADYRGRRIFSRLLNHLWEIDDRPEIDFLMGFPVEMSYGSFIRNGWSNPFDLTWYVRPIRPTAVVRGGEATEPELHFDTVAEQVDRAYPPLGFALSKELEFVEWRQAFSPDAERKYHFHYRESGDVVRLDLKVQRRGRLRGVIVGDVASSRSDQAFVRRAFRALFREVRSHGFLSFVSVALNSAASEWNLPRSMWRLGFVPAGGKSIPFIVKSGGGSTDLTDATRWHVLRSDIDTW